MTNKQVMAYWKVAPLKIDMRVRRYKMYQTWTTEPEHHSQVLAAVFGQTQQDRRNNVHRTKPDLDSSTTLPTPWGQQFWDDLQLAGSTEGLAYVAESTKNRTHSELTNLFDPKSDAHDQFTCF